MFHLNRAGLPTLRLTTVLLHNVCRFNSRSMCATNLTDNILMKKSDTKQVKVKAKKPKKLFHDKENAKEELKSVPLKYLYTHESVANFNQGNNINQVIRDPSKSSSNLFSKSRLEITTEVNENTSDDKIHVISKRGQFENVINNGTHRLKQDRKQQSLSKTMKFEDENLHEFKDRMYNKTEKKMFEEGEDDNSEYGSGENVRDRSSRPKLNQEQIICSMMSSLLDDIISDPTLTKDWSLIGQRFSKSTHLASNWPPIFLNYVANRNFIPNFFDTAMSLATYVAGLSERHRISRLVSTVAICVHQGGESKHELAFSFYEELRQSLQGGDLDSISASSLIASFAKTSRWRECLGFLEMVVKIGALPSSSQYSSIVMAALRNDDIALADRLFTEMYENNVEPTDDLYCYMADHGLVEKLLSTLERFGWIVSALVAELIKDKFLSSHGQKEKWTVSQSVVNRSGVCRGCNKPLEPHQKLTDKEFGSLRRTFMQEALLRGGNLFLNTSPTELEAFRNLLETTESFDVIIDGLNVAYKTRQSASTRERDAVLMEVLKFFPSHLRILVLGRKHMRRWKSCEQTERDNERRNMASVKWFFADNVSADDPFMLYAALHSGQDTQIVTSDELRDHRYLLGTHTAQVLKVWQRGHQVVFNGRFPNRDGSGYRLHFEWPDAHDTRVQHTSDSWHVPFDSGEKQMSYKLPNSWLCIRRLA